MLTSTASVSVELLPFVSTTVIEITFVPDWSGTLAAVHEVVPAATPLPPRSFDHVTDWMPCASAAVPASVMNGVEAVVEAADVGAAMAIDGMVPVMVTKMIDSISV